MKNKTNNLIIRSSLLALTGLMLAGCTTDRLEPVGISDLEHKDPARRIRAIKWAGENQVTEAIPLLIDRLEEQDQAVRFFAICALRKITGEDYGYNYRLPPASCSQAIKRWRQSLTKPPETQTDTAK